MEAADALDLHVSIGETSQCVETICMRIHRMVEQRVDGLILFSGVLEETLPKAALLELWSHDITPVLLDMIPCEGPVCRINDNRSRSTDVAIEYLVKFGHRRIAVIWLGNQEGVRSSLARWGLSANYVVDT